MTPPTYGYGNKLLPTYYALKMPIKQEIFCYLTVGKILPPDFVFIIPFLFLLASADLARWSLMALMASYGRDRSITSASSAGRTFRSNPRGPTLYNWLVIGPNVCWNSCTVGSSINGVLWETRLCWAISRFTSTHAAILGSFFLG